MAQMDPWRPMEGTRSCMPANKHSRSGSGRGSKRDSHPVSQQTLPVTLTTALSVQDSPASFRIRIYVTLQWNCPRLAMTDRCNQSFW